MVGKDSMKHRYNSRSNNGDPFQWHYDGCCRVGGTRNTGSSRWRVIAEVDLSYRADIGRVNRPPVSSQQPIITVIEGRTNKFFMDASDYDMDPLTFRLAQSNEMASTGSVVHPPDISIDAGSGEITWETPSISGSAELWFTNVVISDGHSKIAVDFILQVVEERRICLGPNSCSDCGKACRSDKGCLGNCDCRDNAPPKFKSPSPWIDDALPPCFLPGRESSFLVTAEDTMDKCQNLSIQISGRPRNASFLKELEISTAVQYRFIWSPQPDQDGISRVGFQARDGEIPSDPATLELFVPESEQLPVVDNISPEQGRRDSQGLVNIHGQNFIPSNFLYCRFRLDGQTDDDWENQRAIFMSNQHVMCIVPQRRNLAQNGNDSGTDVVEFKVSNLANCELWVQMTKPFTYLDQCPIGSTEVDGECDICEAGQFSAGGGLKGFNAECIPCPAGRYGSEPGLFTSQCSGLCLRGHFCPAGSTQPAEENCPPGTYGAEEGLGDSSCSGLCEAGFYCPTGGNIEPDSRNHTCKAGYYGIEGETTEQCSGKCAAGYFCEQGSDDRFQNECGSANYYCPVGSSSPTQVDDGHYTIGGSSNKTRWQQKQCEPGYYCENGVRHRCPAGRYGSTFGLGSSNCSGQCREGFFCSEGSSSKTSSYCAPTGVQHPTMYHCPRGVTEANKVDYEHYTVPEEAPERQRTGSRKCAGNEVCLNGKRYAKVEWMDGCTSSGTQTEASASFAIEENAHGSTITVMRAKSNQVIVNEDEVRYNISNISSGENCPDVTGVPDWYELFVPDTKSLFFGESNNNGAFFLKVSFANYEVCSQYTVDVVAEAQGFEAICTVHVSVINVNEVPVWRTANTPDLTSFDVNEHSGRWTLIGHPLHGLIVFDEDELSRSFGQKLTFFTNSHIEEHPGLFSIVPCSGQLSVSKQGDKQLDYEPPPREYIVEIFAHDNYRDSPATVTGNISINVNDINERPFFTLDPDQHKFEIYENSSSGTPLLSGDNRHSKVHADDPDKVGSPDSFAKVFYEIVSQEQGNFFSINATTGAITVAEGASRISYEKTPNHRLVVHIKITDTELSRAEFFFVHILPQNLYPRIEPNGVHFDVFEWASANAFVGKLAARDENRNTTFSWSIRKSTIEQVDGTVSAFEPGPFPFKLEATGKNQEETIVKVNEYGPKTLHLAFVSRYLFDIEVSDGGTPYPDEWEPLVDVAKVIVDIKKVHVHRHFMSIPIQTPKRAVV